MSYLWYWPAGGWDYDRWRRSHYVEPQASPQSGHPDLQPLIQGFQDDDWPCRRAAWLQVARELIGEVSDAAPERVRWEVLDVRRHGTLEQQRIRYGLTAAEWGYAWLCVPAGTIGRPRPAIIALHQTVPGGKDEPMGLEGDAELAYGRELAEQGFVVLAPDAIGFGERRKDHPHARYHTAEQFFAAHPQGSVMAKMVFDVQRAVDLIQQVPQVDSRNIGCMGHSHGGYGTLFGMIFEPRITAGVISCGFTPLRADPTPQRWWRQTALIPRLGFYEADINQAPLDFHHLLALVAPRPLTVVAATEDTIFPNAGSVKQALKLARQAYGSYGAERSLRQMVFHGPHCFPLQARRRAYQMLKKALVSASF